MGEEIIPKNEIGAESNTISQLELENIDEAESFFEIVKRRLTAIKEWHSYAGAFSSDFKHTDSKGNIIERLPVVGDYLQIAIPGPRNSTGDGYDWVQIEDVVHDKTNSEETFGFKVRSAPSPLNNKKDVAHFFADEATSSFIVKREGKKISAAVYGRNEIPNTDTDSVLDKIRNVAVATGAMTAFSKLQWKFLVNGLIKK